MRKTSLYLAVLFVFGLIVGGNSCTKKVNGIDNDMVIETPYSLLFSDTAGALYNSNDGKSIQKIMHSPDGFPCRAICTVNSNILWCKTNLYISTDNGRNFNHSYDSLGQGAFTTCTNRYLDLNQSMIINIPDWGEVFAASSSLESNNYLGVTFSLNYGGLRGYWWIDLPDTVVPPATASNFGNYGPGFEIRMTSFTQLKNGTLCGYDAHSNRNFYRTKTTLWWEVTANPDSFDVPGIGSPFNRSGTALPNHQVYLSSTVTAIDTTSRYSYGHINNRLIAIDQMGCNSNGAFYSDDLGRNWTKYSGLPANRPLLCVSSPFEEITLVGTDSAGLYELNTNTGSFQQQQNNGLGKYLIVRSITAKENIYKNGTHKKFVYLATNLGIYQSTDGGHNWTKTIPGNFVAIY